MNCINTILDIENKELICSISCKKCNFIDCQKLCLNYESEEEFMNELDEVE